jgi:glycosyltransferase involved in cell wall biosynthesis
MPSLYEGFGLPPAEAMACGVPVVASNATSIPEVVQDAGILIDAMDPDAMAEVIRNLLNSPRQREDLIDKGRMIVKEYDPRHVARRMMELFHRTARQV